MLPGACYLSDDECGRDLGTRAVRRPRCSTEGCEQLAYYVALDDVTVAYCPACARKRIDSNGNGKAAQPKPPRRRSQPAASHAFMPARALPLAASEPPEPCHALKVSTAERCKGMARYMDAWNPRLKYCPEHARIELDDRKTRRGPVRREVA